LICIDAKSLKRVEIKREFKKETSVFKDWKEDTPQRIAQMLDDDFNYWKVFRFIKDPEEVSSFF